MEIQKKEYRIIRQKSCATSQITLDEDYNVPDSRPDVGRMIQKKGSVQIQKVKVQEGRAGLTGRLAFCLLYVSDDEERRIHSLDGVIPLDETLNLEGLHDGDKIRLKWEVEDLTIRLIHPRKLNIQAIITFEAVVHENVALMLPEDVRAAEGVSIKKQDVRILGICVHRKDTIRRKEEITLPSNKPDVEEILWHDAQIRGLEMRCSDGEILLKGELFVFVLYMGGEENNPPEWIEQAIPFNDSLECEQCRADMLPNIDLQMIQASVTAKPDADGEERLLQAEVVLEADIRLQREETFNLLMDAYAPTKDYIPVCREENTEHLLIKNDAKCRINDRVEAGDVPGKILQICHSDGSVKVDRTEIRDEGIYVEGVLMVRILYIVSDDNMPFYAMEASVPFQHLIEVPEIEADCRFDMRTDLEQLSTAMVDSREIELRAALNFNTLVLCPNRVCLVQEIRENELDTARIRDLPGIVSYRVEPEDSLWDLAKRYYTTIGEIQALNELPEDSEIRPGQTLLLVKNVES